uniref:Uncharacterized protein n=1 Tax=Timema bartmani TaxID=61472 RepID=A0A7R9F8D3_9NEOP|nr:unnamed protein product [Timema bartmani]
MTQFSVEGIFVSRKSADYSHQLSIEQKKGGAGSRNSIDQMSSLLSPSPCEPCLASAHPKPTTLNLDTKDPCFKKRKEDIVYKKKRSRTHYTGDDCTLIDRKEREREELCQNSEIGFSAADGDLEGSAYVVSLGQISARRNCCTRMLEEVPLFRDVQNPVVLSTAVEIAPTPFMPGRSLSQDKSTMTSFYRTGFSWARVNKPIKHPTTFKKDPKVSFDEEDEEAEEEVSVNHQSKINSGAFVHGDVARKELKSQVDEKVYLDEPEFEVDSILSKQPAREPTKKPGFFAKSEESLLTYFSHPIDLPLFPHPHPVAVTSHETMPPDPHPGIGFGWGERAVLGTLSVTCRKFGAVWGHCWPHGAGIINKLPVFGVRYSYPTD